MVRVYAYRLKPSNIDWVNELLDENQIAIGWSRANVINCSTVEAVKERLDEAYDDLEPKGKLTRDANQVWRFLRELQVGDIVLVPHGRVVYFLQVAGPPLYLPEKVDDDTALRRDVIKLNPASIERHKLPIVVQDRLKFQQASMALDDVKAEVLAIVGADEEVAAVEDELAEIVRLLPEPTKSYSVPGTDERLVARRHGLVWAALVEKLRGIGYKVTNQRVQGAAPDLVAFGGDHSLLFEIKVGVGSSDYLKALGQLLFYEKALRRSFQKYLVVPRGVNDRARQILTELEIGVIEFMEMGTSFSFHLPDEVYLVAGSKEL